MSSQVRRITNRWVAGRFPIISMEHAKAAALRAMVPWIAERAEERRGSSRAALLRARVLSGFAAMDQVYRGQGRFMDSDAAEAAKEHCLDALQALAELQGLFPDGPWRLQPKAHALVHLACDAALGNPRVAHCYQDEDFVGRIKELYCSCHGRTAPRRALQRYALGAALQLTARQELLAGRRAPRAPPLKGGPLAQQAAGPSGHGIKRGRGRPPKQVVKRPKGRPRKPVG